MTYFEQMERSLEKELRGIDVQVYSNLMSLCTHNPEQVSAIFAMFQGRDNFIKSFFRTQYITWLEREIDIVMKTNVWNILDVVRRS